MSVYDQAHSLARALKNSTEYVEYAAAKGKVDADPNASRMLKDFQQRQIDIQKEQLLNGKVSDGQMKQYEQMYEVISLNPAIKDYLTAEFRLARLLTDIQKIIGEAIELGSETQE